MPGRIITTRGLRTPEGRETFDAFLRAARAGDLDQISTTLTPIENTFDEAVNRADALLRSHERITFEEKLQAFEIMGFKPVPRQLDIVRDDHQMRVVRAGRRSGKTTTAAAEAVAVMLMKPGSFGWIVGPDKDLTFRCWEMVVAHLDRLAARGLIRYKVKQSSVTQMRIKIDNGSVIEGQSAERAEDLQGVGLDYVIIDEIGQILQFVFTEFIFPALAQKNGWAYLIGTPIGESWTEKEVRHQQAEAKARDEECDWSEHLFETWHNTYEFPGGKTDPKIKKMQRTMNYEEFMEQVCARPQRSRYVTFKEFDERVHVRTCRYDPDRPVYLSIDPSTGVNPYAVAAFQDYGEMIWQIDEYYRISVIAEDVINALAERPWWNNVQDAILDDAWPQERELWRRHPKTRHFPISKAGKTHYIVDSIPLVRAWLRDPARYNAIVQPIRERLAGESYPGKEWLDLEYLQQDELMKEAEGEANERLDLLVDCARYFVDRRCINTIDEFTGYMYKKRKRDDQNPSEMPVANKDHLMDAIRYFLWRYKRGLGVQRPRPRAYAEV